MKLDKPARTGTGVTVEIRRIRSIKAKAQLPGEVAGPALALTVKITNTGTKPVDLNSVVVTLTDSADGPGIEMTAAPAKPLTGMLGPDQAREGVYVFALPRSKRDPVTVLVTVLGAPVLVFTGNAD